MASAPAPDAVDKMEAFAAIARAAAERPVVSQNAPVAPSEYGTQYHGTPLPDFTPGGLFPRPPVAEKNALLPNGSVRLDGQVYRWAEMKDGSGAWVVVVTPTPYDDRVGG